MTSARSSISDCALQSVLWRLTRVTGDSHRPGGDARSTPPSRCSAPCGRCSAARRDLRQPAPLPRAARGRGKRMLSNWSSGSGSAVITTTVVQHSAEALPPTGVLCPFPCCPRQTQCRVRPATRRTAGCPRTRVRGSTGAVVGRRGGDEARTRHSAAPCQLRRSDQPSQAGRAAGVHRGLGVRPFQTHVRSGAR